MSVTERSYRPRDRQLIEGDTVMMTTAELSAILRGGERRQPLISRKQCIDALNRGGYSPLWEQMSTEDLIFCASAVGGANLDSTARI